MGPSYSLGGGLKQSAPPSLVDTVCVDDVSLNFPEQLCVACDWSMIGLNLTLMSTVSLLSLLLLLL